MTNSLIDRCPNSPACGGRIRIVSLSRDERMRRRIGQAMIGKCPMCGTETTVNKQAWAIFAKDQRRKKREADVSGGEWFRFMNEPAGISDEYDHDDE